MMSAILIALFLRVSGAGTSTEVPTLVRSARDLLRSGQPSKALVLLQRARSLDSSQVDLDRLAAQCNFQLGNWVPMDGGSDWAYADDRFDRSIRDNPDSMFQIGRKLSESENLAGAVRIFWGLSKSHAATPAYLKAYNEHRARQDIKIAFHRDLAQKAQNRGEAAEALSQWRMAYAARPEDPALRDMVEKADQTNRFTYQIYLNNVQRALAARDERSAIDLLRKARIIYPATDPFQRLFDSLDAGRVSFRVAKLDQINNLADLGRDQEAVEAMEALVETDPQEPALVAAQDVLQSRIQKRRRATQIAELSRSCDQAIQNGDLAKAEAVFFDLRKAGGEGSDVDKIRLRLDSLSTSVRSSGAFNEAMSSTRQALKAGDLAAGRNFLQKALTVQPDNAVAKGIMKSLASAASKSTQPIASKPLSTEARTSVSGRTEQDIAKSKQLLLAGVAAYRSGEYAKAVESWKLVLAIDPDNVQAQKYLTNVGLKQTRLK
jgi:tetratricopeptide (TPR) repeat protein